MRLRAKETRDIHSRAYHAPQMPPMMDVLESILSKRDYLEGEFTVADVAVGAYLCVWFIYVIYNEFC